MTVRLLHTADWQLGRGFSGIGGDAAALLREARFEAVRRLARLAAEHEVAAVLVAGDVFDGNQVADATIHRALQAMSGFQGPWVLLPGNHDAHLAECVWTRLERLGPPGNLHIAARPEPMALADGRLVVLPAPLTARRTPDDLSSWMDTAETPAAALRIGLAHGAVLGRLPAGADADNPIAADRAERARLDYLALGDWHGTLEIDRRCWYAGTPEPDRFPANDPGNALLVELDGPGSPPRVTRLPVAGYRWLTLELREADAATVDRRLGELADAPRTLLSLRLSGSAGLAERAAVDAACERWAARLCHLVIDDGDLVTLPEASAGGLPDDGGPIGAVARRLAERGRAGEADAAMALRLLWAELERMPPA
ncbi:MAG TPA: DNA repair exonuclease [Geminicoccaceae bacterium]|nr:DNA repair exonuclease [Geminicoccus sp.]HMU50499.1 DNA repair exonuclease [Geminicoccaceae bacterium]